MANAEQFSNPAGIVAALREAQKRLRPDWKEPEQRAREALAEAAEAVRAALPAPDGWRAERKILNLTDRLFPVEAEEVKQ